MFDIANWKLPEQHLLINVKKKKLCLVSSNKAAHVLCAYLCIYMEFNMVARCWYVYHSDLGVWREVSSGSVLNILRSVFRKLAIYNLINNHSYLANLMKYMRENPAMINLQYPSHPDNLVAFKNCTVDSNNQVFPHAPETKCYTYVSYDYNPTASCPNFLAFLSDFCSSKKDRIDLLQAFMRCCIEGTSEAQKFIEFVGPTSTGKTTFETVLHAFIGKENTLTTTLKALNAKTFDMSLLRNKRLVLISDSMRYTGSIENLKKIVEGGSAISRQKYTQENQGTVIEGLVAVFGNRPIDPKDATVSFYRKHILFPATNTIVKNTGKDLISCQADGTFKGLLADELSGIYNWTMQMDENRAIELLSFSEEQVPSLSENREFKTNAMVLWAEAELVPGDGIYVGSATPDEEDFHMAYPLYIAFCKRQGFKPVSFQFFDSELVSVIKSELAKLFPVEVKKVKNENGIFISGISFNKKVFNIEYQRGGLMLDQVNKSPSSSLKEYPVSVPEDVAPALRKEDVVPALAKEEGVPTLVKEENFTVLVPEENLPALVPENAAVALEPEDVSTKKMSRKLGYLRSISKRMF